MFGRILSAVLTVAYPFVVFFGLKYWGLNALIILIVALCGLNCLLKPGRFPALFFTVALILAAASFFTGVTLPLKLYPVAISATLLATFALSLFSKQSAIERIARIQDPNLPPEGVRYTRKLTLIWCAFFLINGCVALWTAVAADEALWAIYNGFVSYLLIGLLLVGEWLFRRFVIKKH